MTDKYRRYASEGRTIHCYISCLEALCLSITA